MNMHDKLVQLYRCVKTVRTERSVPQYLMATAKSNRDLEVELSKHMCLEIAQEIKASRQVNFTRGEDVLDQLYTTYRAELLVLSREDLQDIAALLRDGEDWGLELA